MSLKNSQKKYRISTSIVPNSLKKKVLSLKKLKLFVKMKKPVPLGKAYSQ